MPVDMTKESLWIHKMVGQKTQNVMIEGDLIVPDVKPDILSTIATNGNVCIYKKEVLEGKVRMDGEVQIDVIYLADSENMQTRSLHTSIDFTQMMDFEEGNPQMSLEEKVIIQSIECNILNGRKIKVKAMLIFEATLYSNETIEILKQVSGLEDVQTLKQNLTFNALIGEGSSKAYAKDTIMIENIDSLAEILKTEIHITNKDIKMSYHKVLAKADVCVKMLYLTEDQRIKMVEASIPVMGFVDIENVTEEDICDTRYTIKNIIVKPNSQEEHSIYVEVEVELACRVYQNKQMDVIQDMYSPSKCLMFQKKMVNTMAGRKMHQDTCQIKEKIAIPEIGDRQIYDVVVRPILLEQRRTNSKVVYEGELALTFLYATDQMAGVGVKEVRVPFEHSQEAPLGDHTSNLEIEMEVQKQDFVVIGDGVIEGRVDIEFHLQVSNTITMNMIDDVKIDETGKKEIYSMIIYFVKPEDTLWKIAKRFGSTVCDIVRVNEIEDENKIYPGQQLFIPKYVYTKKEVSA